MVMMIDQDNTNKLQIIYPIEEETQQDSTELSEVKLEHIPAPYVWLMRKKMMKQMQLQEKQEYSVKTSLSGTIMKSLLEERRESLNSRLAEHFNYSLNNSLNLKEKKKTVKSRPANCK